MAPSRINYTTLTEQLEEAIRVDILEGALRPGQRIRATELTERYGVSATPLREALQRLAVNKLVEIDPRLGATVSPISEKDLADIYDMLQLLDSLALERSIERGGDDWLSQLDAAFARFSEVISQQEAITDATPADKRRAIALDLSASHSAFHRALYSACDSTWLMDFVDTLRKHAERYRMLTLAPHSGASGDLRGEHEKIYLAARRRDAQAACDALRKDMATTAELLRVRLAEVQFAEGDEVAAHAIVAPGK